MADSWVVNNLKVTLKVTDKLVLDFIDQKTKEAWSTSEIDEQGASKIIEGLWEDPLATLANMIRDSFNNVSGVQYALSFKVGTQQA